MKIRAIQRILLYFEAVSLIKQQGLDPYLGVYHQSEHGRYSLACDVMEPIRPSVDRWVLALLQLVAGY